MNLRFVSGAAAAFFLLQCGTALAATRDDVLEALGKCATLQDDKARLACYDALSPRVKDALATPPAALDRPPTADEQKTWFGFDVGSGTHQLVKQYLQMVDATAADGDIPHGHHRTHGKGAGDDAIRHRFVGLGCGVESLDPFDLQGGGADAGQQAGGLSQDRH